MKGILYYIEPAWRLEESVPEEVQNLFDFLEFVTTRELLDDDNVSYYSVCRLGKITVVGDEEILGKQSTQ
jgi:hypothetical protein